MAEAATELPNRPWTFTETEPATATEAPSSQEVQQDLPANLLYFDFSCRSLWPRHSVEEDDNDEALEEDVIPVACLQPMHVVTLEFEDLHLEADFLEDLSRRTKQWLSGGLIFGAVIHFVNCVYALYQLNSSQDQWQWVVLMPGTSCLLFVAQWSLMHLRATRELVLKHWQEVLFLWAIPHIACRCIVAFTIPVPPEYFRGSMSLQMFLTFVFYRMRFIYFLVYAVSVVSFIALYVYITQDPVSDRSDFYMGACLSFLAYTAERCLRKDYVSTISTWKEAERSETLLKNILPNEVLNNLKLSTSTTLGGLTRSFPSATIFFADVVSFTTMSATISPLELVKLLNFMFHEVDDIAVKNGVEKIKTIGDCYMAATGLPVPNPQHAQAMARFGLEVLDLVDSGVLINPTTKEKIRVRAGMHSGPCVAGVIGFKKFCYDVWGDAVNTASRMESHGEPMKLHCSSDSYELLASDFDCEKRPRMYVKGKGEMDTFFIKEEFETSKEKVYRPQ